jgi:hypothetical protein
VMMLFCFSCALGAVGIVIRNFGHTAPLCRTELRRQTSSELFAGMAGG